MVNLTQEPPNSAQLQKLISHYRRERLAQIKSKNLLIVKLVMHLVAAGLIYYIADTMIGCSTYVTWASIFILAFVIEKVITASESKTMNESHAQLLGEIASAKGKAPTLAVQNLRVRGVAASAYLDAVEKQGRRLSNHELHALNEQLDEVGADDVWSHHSGHNSKRRSTYQRPDELDTRFGDF